MATKIPFFLQARMSWLCRGKQNNPPPRSIVGAGNREVLRQNLPDYSCHSIASSFPWVVTMSLRRRKALLEFADTPQVPATATPGVITITMFVSMGRGGSVHEQSLEKAK